MANNDTLNAVTVSPRNAFMKRSPFHPLSQFYRFHAYINWPSQWSCGDPFVEYKSRKNSNWKNELLKQRDFLREETIAGINVRGSFSRNGGYCATWKARTISGRKRERERERRWLMDGTKWRRASNPTRKIEREGNGGLKSRCLWPRQPEWATG